LTIGTTIMMLYGIERQGNEGFSECGRVGEKGREGKPTPGRPDRDQYCQERKTQALALLIFSYREGERTYMIFIFVSFHHL
jgi:hypothetical protein